MLGEVMNLGTVLEKKYKLKTLVDENILGGLYLAKNIRTNKNVLINFLPYDSQICLKKHYFEDFFIEVDKSSGYKNKSSNYPNIFITSVGEVKGGKAYLVLEYVDSLSLEKTIKETGKLSPEKAIKIAIQICATIIKINSLGIIYRNINSKTIMLDLSNNNISTFALDIDIDINKLYSQTQLSILYKTLGVDPNQLKEEVVFDSGGANFITPEKAQGIGESYPQSEIYTLGILLYLMLAGEFPFKGKALMNILMHAIQLTPQPLTNYKVPENLDILVSQVLAKDRNKRPKSILELSNQLKALLPKANPSLQKHTKTSHLYISSTANHSKQSDLELPTIKTNKNVQERQTNFFEKVVSFFQSLLKN